MSNPPVLTTRDLNRALLARQLLLERSNLPLTTALEAVAGLQTQYAPSAYIGLWSRLEGFKRESLTTALEDRSAVQGTLMRSTIHIVSAGDYPRFAEAIRRGRREWWMSVQRHQVEGLDMDRVAATLRKHLEGAPLRESEIVRLLEGDGFPRIAWIGARLWLDLVRVPPSGTWERRRADLYGLADEWLHPPAFTEDEALDHLVRRYLGGFGPASLKDLANWAGLRVNVLKPVVERMRLRQFRDEKGGVLFDLPDGPLPDPDTLAPARFLPTWDATLLVHARRTQILPERFRPLVFHTRTPHSVPTFLIDGAVAGKWRYDDGQIRLEPFDGISASARRELEQEGERLAAFHQS